MRGMRRALARMAPPHKLRRDDIGRQ